MTIVACHQQEGPIWMHRGSTATGKPMAAAKRMPKLAGGRGNRVMGGEDVRRRLTGAAARPVRQRARPEFDCA
jgi:hypothetical protein